jgi:fumarate hydratase subunit alpha
MSQRLVHTEEISAKIKALYGEACVDLGPDVLQALNQAALAEEGPGRRVLELLIENAEVARRERLPLCQDTGIAVVWLQIGRDVRLEGPSIEDAVHEGVAQASQACYLRASILDHPLTRHNTGDNAPGVVHVDLVEGNQVKVLVLAKGAGSENTSAVAMLKPWEGRDGVIRFVKDVVKKAGPNACPPLVVGVGLGGTMDKACERAKWALFRPVGVASSLDVDQALERDLLREINATQIGPMALGGKTTALAVHVESFPCHMASLPVAVCLNCHAHRVGRGMI